MSEVKVRKLSHKGSKQKGSRGEYAIRDGLIRIGIDAKRVPMSGALSWMKGDVREFNTNPQHVHEVKNCEKLELGDWWRQSSDQIRPGEPEIPTLIFSGNYRKQQVVMRTTDFDDLVYAYEQHRPELTINLIDFPSRKNFWKFQETTLTGGHDVYLWNLAGRTIGTISKATGLRKDRTYPDEQLAIFPFDMYLMLRKHQIKGQTA